MYNKPFFGKNTCLKIQTSESDAYIHIGKKKEEEWDWTKLKMSDVELGHILRVLKDETGSWSTVHEFQGNQNKIWVNKNEGTVFFKVNDVTKALNPGEQKVLSVILKKVIEDINQD